jgi:uncharacterized protein DUF3883
MDERTWRSRCDMSPRLRGDGAGYDIFSFDTTGAPKYIEVKTTTGP